jgi:hypothetical protein
MSQSFPGGASVPASRFGERDTSRHKRLARTLAPPWLFALLAMVLFSGCTTSSPPRETRTEWIDRDTGHRVVQLSREPGSESLYFNLNPFTPDGRHSLSPTASSPWKSRKRNRISLA